MEGESAQQLLPEYKQIERNVEAAIFERFRLDPSSRSTLKAVDLSVLAAEQAQIMPDGTDSWAMQAGVVPAQIFVRFLNPEKARLEFLQKFRTLIAEGAMFSVSVERLCAPDSGFPLPGSGDHVISPRDLKVRRPVIVRDGRRVVPSTGPHHTSAEARATIRR
jgi:hypothetical protein